jgi:hypothetical protein
MDGDDPTRMLAGEAPVDFRVAPSRVADEVEPALRESRREAIENALSGRVPARCVSS